MNWLIRASKACRSPSFKPSNSVMSLKKSLLSLRHSCQEVCNCFHSSVSSAVFGRASYSFQASSYMERALAMLSICRARTSSSALRLIKVRWAALIFSLPRWMVSSAPRPGIRTAPISSTFFDRLLIPRYPTIPTITATANAMPNPASTFVPVFIRDNMLPSP